MVDQNRGSKPAGLWESANGVKVLLNGQTQPATAEQIVSALIAVGNGQNVDLARWNEGEHRLRSRGGARSALYSEFSGLLAQAVEDRAGLAESFLPIGLELIGSLRVSAAIEFGGTGLVLAYFHDFQTLRSALQYGVLLLLILNQPFGAALCRCRLKRCGVFYLAARKPGGGPANRQYCTPEHRTEAHNLKQNRSPRKPK